MSINNYKLKLKYIFPVFLTIYLYSHDSCSSGSSKENNIEAIQKKEMEATNKMYQNTGKLISGFEFKLKATKEQEKEWNDGYIPWISLSNPESQIKQLVDADEKIIKYQTINIIFDYPLNNPAIFEFKNSNYFSRKDLILAISKKYHEIYNEEEKSSKIKTIPLDERTGIINRNETQGKYGIWGHDLSDLDLSSIEVYETDEGKINILLIIES